MNKKPSRYRFISNQVLSREQALWLSKAVLLHYRKDQNDQNDHPSDFYDFLNRAHKNKSYKRGRDWATQPIGYDINEVTYGTEISGIKEIWASLVSLPISRNLMNEKEYRTFYTYGLKNGNKLAVAVYKISEIFVTSVDISYVNYVKDCLSRLLDDFIEVPEYISKKDSLLGRFSNDQSIFIKVKK